MMRPLGRPPMPRAISRPSDPVEVDSISCTGLSAPSFMIDPLPNWRSICASALSRAFCLSGLRLLSMESRSAVAISLTSLFHTLFRAAINASFSHCSQNVCRQKQNISRDLFVCPEFRKRVKKSFRMARRRAKRGESRPMLVFSKQKLVLLSVPKTGTTAFQAALAPHASMVITDPPELKHAPVFRYNRFFRPALEKFVGAPLDVLAVLREPVDWLGSWYRYRRRPFMQGQRKSTHAISFDTFVEGYVQGDRPGYADVGSQAKFLESRPNGVAVKYLFRYDDQDRLVAFLEERLGCRITLARENVSPAMPLDLAPKLEAKLRRKCAAEFDLYDSIG